MYATTNQAQAQREVETAERIILKYDGRDDLCMAKADALAAAKATVRMYGCTPDDEICDTCPSVGTCYPG